MAWSHSARHSSWSGTDGGGPSRAISWIFFLPYVTCTGTASATIWFGGSGESCGIVGWFSAWTGPFRSPPSAIHLGLGPGVSERGKEPHVTDRHAVLLLQVSRPANVRDVISLALAAKCTGHGRMARPPVHVIKKKSHGCSTHCIVRALTCGRPTHAHQHVHHQNAYTGLLATRSLLRWFSFQYARIQLFAAVELAREISLISTPIAVNNGTQS